jgi:hypothetical protein
MDDALIHRASEGMGVAPRCAGCYSHMQIIACGADDLEWTISSRPVDDPRIFAFARSATPQNARKVTYRSHAFVCDRSADHIRASGQNNRISKAGYTTAPAHFADG